MPFAIKRPWNYDDEEREFGLHQPAKLQRRGPLTDINLGLVTPPTTPEKLNKHNSLVSIKQNNQIVRRLNFTEEIHSPYSDAKKVFLRGSSNEFQDGSRVCLPGRETEGKLLKKYIEESLIELQSTSIYISGPPGTGKTAQVGTIIQSLTLPALQNCVPGTNIYNIPLRCHSRDVLRKLRVVKINCMTLKNPEQIFDILAKNLEGCNHRTGKLNTKIDHIRELLSDRSSSDMTILVLDEMDSVINKYQQALFELFSWASNLPSVQQDSFKPNLILVGIANALDLTDRFLPRLRSNRINPRLIQFLPYTADQIQQVITQKLYGLDEDSNGHGLPPIVHPTAIKFCAKKAAVNTGDLRKAFDIIHRAIEIVEQTTMKRMPCSKFTSLTVNNAPKVMISQIARVCSSAFNINYQLKLQALNLQSKTILCCLFKFEEKQDTPYVDMFKKGAGRRRSLNKIIPSINNFFEFYNRHLKMVDRMLSTLRRGEFLEVLSTLESNSLINLTFLADKSGKFMTSNVSNTLGNGSGSPQKGVVTFGNYKISTNVPKSELVKSIGDIELLRKIMSAPIASE
ncbi:hypothetical protein FOA43_004125 [Brettanomyces nanus]|uniref:Cell division control protein n=1 Tax=Eeniella nana TaxID=13502 RepID=A0A875S519_EENNA|nr:uncharacterized protein FOA43_004125 [Brettanomyces nanus]QPG76731.1 hypothetical protein FOA43_004125 [Brettanomyces nanus]